MWRKKILKLCECVVWQQKKRMKGTPKIIPQKTKNSLPLKFSNYPSHPPLHSFLPPMILLFQSSRPSRLLNISFQNESLRPPEPAPGGEFSLKVYKYWQNTAVDTGAVPPSRIMEWNMTQDAGTENCSPPDCCSRRGKGELGRGAIWESGEDVRKMWKANERNIIQSNLPLLTTHCLGDQTADPISWDPLKLADEEGRWRVNGVDAITSRSKSWRQLSPTPHYPAQAQAICIQSLALWPWPRMSIENLA